MQGRKQWAILLVVAFAATAMAGCSSKSAPSSATAADTSRAALAEGKGAISGLFIDDVYVPIPGALVLLQGTGLTATTDELGQFQFLDVEPGSYVAVATAPAHEAAPVNVDVVAAQYTDLEIQGRRLFSENGRTVSSEYSVFVPCSVDFVVNGVVTDCTGDQSGDSFRAGYTSDYTAYNKSATYLVVEMKANVNDSYEVQLRQDDGSSGGGPRYAVADFHSDYLRMQFKVGDTNAVYNGQANNVAFSVNKTIALILFSDSQGRQELQGAGAPVCCGAGAHFGIKAKFIQTLFLGKPEVDVDHYCVLASSC